MGLLVGLPLKLLHTVFVLVRLAWPLLLVAAVLWVLRRKLGVKLNRPKWGQKKDFDGPVVEVDYTVVDEEEQP